MKGNGIILTLVTLISILFSCKKEEIIENLPKAQLPEISIINFDENKQYFQLDTISINYELNDFELDSICLFIQKKLIQTQIIPQNKFIFIADSAGSNKITLAAFYNDTIQDIVEKNLQVYKTYNDVSLLLNCSTTDGDKNYFVGEKLIIYVEPMYEIGWLQITKFKEITFYLNGIKLGTKYSLPFVFETGIISETDNTVKLEMVDKENHIYFEELQLKVPVNTPPVIKYGYKYKYGVTPGYFYSLDPIFFSTDGSDNVSINYIEYYIDDKLFTTDIVNLNYFNYRELSAGLLPAGKHTSYCIAYDDRGTSTKSEILNFINYGTVQIDKDMVDLERTMDKNFVYAISGSTLFKINPVDEVIEKQFPLPFQDATCMKYVSESKRLYIGFQDGHLIYFNELSNEFTTILSSAISNIVDLEIDNSLNRAIVVSIKKILLFDLSANSILDEFSSSEEINSLAIDSQNKIIIASANPHSTGGYLYKLNYNSNSITLNQQKYGIGFPLKILFKKNYNVFTVLTNGSYGFNSYYTNNLSNAGRFSESYTVGAGCYSSDGNYFYMDNNFLDLIDYCNTSDYLINKTCYLPLEGHNQVEFLTTNADDSKLIILTDDVFDNDVKLVFVRL